MLNPKTSNKRPNWSKIKAAYQRGEGSCRELAIDFGVNQDTLSNRCKREKWRSEITELKQKVAEKVVENLVDRATQWVEDTITRGQRARTIIDATIEQYATDDKGRPVIEMPDVSTMLHAEQKADDLTRRALGLKDEVEVNHKGSVGMVLSKEVLEELEQVKNRFEIPSF